MFPHPVQLRIQTLRLRRVHIAVRLVAIAALSAVGCSSGYWVLYLTLPVLAALLISRDGADRYLEADAPAVVRVLRWIARAYAYLWLLTDALPTTGSQTPIELTIEVGGTPTVGTALWRLVTSLPALLLLALMSIFAAALWIIGAIAILATERVPSAITDFIAMKLRYQLRLVAYHLSLVDAYPATTDSPQPHAPQAGTA